jgi:hypothetical protein
MSSIADLFLGLRFFLGFVCSNARVDGDAERDGG